MVGRYHTFRYQSEKKTSGEGHAPGAGAEGEEMSSLAPRSSVCDPFPAIHYHIPQTQNS